MPIFATNTGTFSPLSIKSIHATGSVGDFLIGNSLRFDQSQSPRLYRDYASSGNRRTYTFSVWVKLGKLAHDGNIFTTSSTPGDSNASSPRTEFRFGSNGTIMWAVNSTGSSWKQVNTTNVFVDPSGWYHIVVATDTTQVTDSNRVKIYVNGVQQTLTGDYPGSSDETPYNHNYEHNIGTYANNYNDFFDGYMAEIYSIDGQALAATDFGEFDATTGIWKPKAYTGNYNAAGGVNGFHLNFSNSSDVGEDQAGSNDFTASGLVVGDYADATITNFVGDNANATSGVSSISGSGYNQYAFLNFTNNSGQHIFYHQANQGTSTWFFSDSGHSYVGTHSSEQQGNTLGYRNDGTNYNDHVSTWGTFATANGTTSGYTASNPQGGISGGTVTGLNQTNAVNVWKFVVDMTNHKVWIDPGTGSYAGGGDPSNTSSTATFQIPDADLKFWSTPYTSTNTMYSNGRRDIMKDSPSSGDPSTDTGLGGQLVSNYATLNPLNQKAYNTSSLSDGNLKLSATASNGFIDAQSTIAASLFDCYCEVTVTAGGGAALQGIGVGDITATISTGVGSYVTYRENGAVIKYPGNTTLATVGSYTTGDVLGMTITSTQVAFYKNGSLQGTYNHSLTGEFFACGMSYHNGSTSILDFNFGQAPFSHQAPSGFKCLCTANLPDSDIADGTTALSITTWDGDGGGADTVTGLNLVNDPGFIWTKTRNFGYHNTLWDIVRGYNLTNALITDYNGSATGGKVTSVTPSSFSHDGGLWFNENTRQYVAWAFDAGSTTSTIAAGSSNSSAYDQSQTWSNYLTTSGGSGTASFGSGAFGGFDNNNNYTYVGGSTSGTNYTITFTPPSTISYTSSLIVRAETNNSEVSIDGGSTWVADVGGLVTFNGPGSFSSIICRDSRGQFSGDFYSIRVDGKLLVDSGVSVTNVPERECKVRANQTAGFSVVKVDSPDNTEGRVHGLTKAPDFIMAKSTAQLSENWHMFHSVFGKSHYGIFSNAAFASSDQWGSQEPNSNSFYVKANTGSGANYAGGMIYYIWHAVPGFSAFGEFINPFTTQGAFVYCGFRPALIIAKCAENISSANGLGDWVIKDTTRNPFNNPSDGNTLLANTSDTEDGSYSNTQARVDILSNGFKIQHPNSSPLGDTGRRYIYCAWAEHPFKQSLAR